MFVITNRNVVETKKGLDALEGTPNVLGPNELRLAEATKKNGKWSVGVLDNMVPPEKMEFTPEELMAAGLRLPEKGGKLAPMLASRYAVYKTLLNLRARQKQKGSPPALAFFVHGYNNDIEAVLDRAQVFENLYGVEVVAFSWPANGGGLRGTMSYLSDKRDALLSVGALDRALIKVHEYLKKLNEERVKKIEDAAKKYEKLDDAEGWDVHFSRSMMSECPFTLNLILHSMGNYVFKHYMSSSTYGNDRLIFDNVILAAADANNPGHAEWVDKIQCRKRVYVTINENDVALRASRMKAGEEQKARLGHWPYGLDSRRAVYVDFTSAKGVGDSHAYFEGGPAKNTNVRRFFELALNGAVAEEGLVYDMARNLYRVP